MNRLPETQGQETLQKYETFTIPGLGMNVAYREHFNTATGTLHGCFSTLFGATIGDPNASCLDTRRCLMADVALNAVFPNAKFLTTNAKGDIQEIIGVDAVSASKDIDGLTFTAKVGGASGNNLSITIVDNVGSGGVAYSNAGDAHTISLEESADQYSLSGMISDIGSNAPSTFTDVFEVTLATSGSGSNKLTVGGVSATNLENGADEITSELTPSKSYLLISSDDIADYDGPEEEADGRKVFTDFWKLQQTTLPICQTNQTTYKLTEEI